MVALGVPNTYFRGGYKQLSLSTVIPIWNSPRACERNLLQDYPLTCNYFCPETLHSPPPSAPPPLLFLHPESDVELEAGPADTTPAR